MNYNIWDHSGSTEVYHVDKSLADKKNYVSIDNIGSKAINSIFNNKVFTMLIAMTLVAILGINPNFWGQNSKGGLQNMSFEEYNKQPSAGFTLSSTLNILEKANGEFIGINLNKKLTEWGNKINNNNWGIFNPIKIFLNLTVRILSIIALPIDGIVSLVLLMNYFTLQIAVIGTV